MKNLFQNGTQAALNGCPSSSAINLCADADKFNSIYSLAIHRGYRNAADTGN